MVLDDEVTTKVAAQYLGVTVFRVLQLITAGKLVSDKKGTRDHWITAESLKEYKKTRKVGRPRGTISEEPADNQRGPGDSGERYREYQRNYKRQMRAAAQKKEPKDAVKHTAAKRKRAQKHS